MPRLLTIGQAAEELRVSVPTLRTWANKGIIHVIKLPSGYRRFEQEDVDQMKRQMGLTRPAEEQAR